MEIAGTRQAVSDREASAARDGHGRRLTRALEALEVFPALAESRDRRLSVVGEERPSTSDIVGTVETDPALAIAVLRVANRPASPRAGKVASIRHAVDLLGAGAVESLASRTDVFDFFERKQPWNSAPERFRLHAITVQRAADRIARELDHANRDELLVAALLHDVGKLALVQAYSGYPEQVHGGARTPEARLGAERRALGVDHSLIGGCSRAAGIFRCGSPRSSSATTRTTSTATARSPASPTCWRTTSTTSRSSRVACSGRRAPSVSTPGACRAILFDLPHGGATERRHVDPCPLSGRELEIVRRLAEGKVYKQIPADLGLSTSTVRTHLHNTYGKLGAVDRAQAVLVATQRGWLER